MTSGLNEFLPVNISQCDEIKTCWDNISRSRWSISGGKVRSRCQSHGVILRRQEEGRERKTEVAVRQRLPACGCWSRRKRGTGLSGSAGINRLHLNASMEKQGTLRAPAPSPPFVPKPPIPCLIWMGCPLEFWWRKTRKTSLFPELPPCSTSSLFQPPSIFTRLLSFLITVSWMSDIFQVALRFAYDGGGVVMQELFLKRNNMNIIFNNASTNCWLFIYRLETKINK